MHKYTKTLRIIGIIVAIFLLGACGGKETAEQEPIKADENAQTETTSEEADQKQEEATSDPAMEEQAETNESQKETAEPHGKLNIEDEIRLIMELIEDGYLDQAESRKERLAQRITTDEYNSSLRALDDMLLAAKYEKEQADIARSGSLKEQYYRKAQLIDEKIHRKYNGDVPIGSYGDYFEDWDGLLNEVWGVLRETMPADEFEALKQDQREWIKRKEAQYEQLKNEIDAKDVLTNTTRERTYYLIEQFME